MYKLYINGVCVEGKGKPIQVVNPATGKVVDVFNGASIEQAEEALQAAKKAFKTWSFSSPNERTEWLQKLKAACMQKKDQLIELMTLESGKAYMHAAGDFALFLKYFDFFPEEIKRVYGTELPQYDNHRDSRHLVIRQPLGVAIHHLAWNVVGFNLGVKLCPTIASGCTGVLKPSISTPLFTLKVGELCEHIGLPAGIINMIAGPSGEIGNYLTASPIPSLVSLIGSTETGKAIIEKGATSIKRYSLELGGNAPCIVMPDCDLDVAAKYVANRKVANCGQGCANINRVFVHESIHDQFVETLLPFVKAIPLGFGKDMPANTCGAQISVNARDEKLRMIREAVNCGAKLLYGGKIPENLPDALRDGAFIMPTVLDGVTDDMPIANKELFAPIITIFTFQDTDEVIRRANGTEFGLSSYLFTHDARVIGKCAELLECGELSVNGAAMGYNMPHAGMKSSGVGCAQSLWSLEDYYQIRLLSIKP